jgi:cysteine desulfurase
MIYLDYSATTPVNEEVLNTFNKVCRDYIGNPNSLHRLGKDANKLMNEATKQIASLLKVNETEIIYTSGATESNNLALKGVASFYKNRGKHIITTNLEHASIKETFNYLEKQGFNISYVNLLDNGLVDLNHLKSLITEDTILVSICSVDSEIGLKQPIMEIGKLLKAYPKVIFHVDGTQAVGKININLANVDLFSFSAHKFYGLKGIGCLIKKENIELESIIHGGKSNTIYRSGTPTLPLIISLAKALRLSFENLEIKYQKVLKLNQKIKKELKKYSEITINSNEYSIPHILNISLNQIKPETFIRAMEKYEIYFSTKSACSLLDTFSTSLLALNKNEKEASTSIRISLSYLTTEQEIEQFLTFFAKEYQALNLKKREE